METGRGLASLFKKALWRPVLAIGCLLGLGLFGGVWAYAGNYGLHVLLRHGGTYWISVRPDSSWLSPSMRLALADDPVAAPGQFEWRRIGQGFEVADLPAIAEGQVVDHIMLARIDPAMFRFELRSDPSGEHDLDQWMSSLKPALVVNGSYYGRDGRPDTPVVAGGRVLGPSDYNAKAGAFVASVPFTGIRDLRRESWKAAFTGAETALVSYPLLVRDGDVGVSVVSRWLANRSFVGEDQDGRIIIGTTADAFFWLKKLAIFLRDAPLGLATALNLDGGPVASQAVSLNGFTRRTYGRWEAQVEGDKVELLTWPYGTVAMPVVLAVFPK